MKTTETQSTDEPPDRDRLREIQERYKGQASEQRTYQVSDNDLAWLIQEVQLLRSRVSAPTVAPEVDGGLRKACHDLIQNNGGLIDSLEGPDTYVMVRREDFESLDRMEKSCATPRSGAGSGNSAAFTAYNQAIDDAKAAIRAESQGGGYWAAAYINAIARRCSPHVYVNRLEEDGSVAGTVDNDLRTPLDEIETALISIADGTKPEEAVRQAFDVINRERLKLNAAAASPVSPVEQANQDEIRFALEGMIAAFDRHDYASTQIAATTRECALSVAKQAVGWAEKSTSAPLAETEDETPPTFKNTKEAMLYAQRQGIPAVIPVTDSSSTRARVAAEEILKRINAALTATVPSEFIEAFGAEAGVTVGEGAIPKIAAIIEHFCFSAGQTKD